MMACCVFGVLGGVNVMGVSEVGMVSGLVVVAGFVMPGCFGVVMGGHAVMVGGLAVFMNCLFGHRDSSGLRDWFCRPQNPFA